MWRNLPPPLCDHEANGHRNPVPTTENTAPGDPVSRPPSARRPRLPAADRDILPDSDRRPPSNSGESVDRPAGPRLEPIAVPKAEDSNDELRH